MTLNSSAPNLTAETDLTFNSRELNFVGGGSVLIDEVSLTDASTISWNIQDESNASVTLGGNRTLSITGAGAGSTGVLRVIQGTGTTHTLALPAGSEIIGGGSYTTTTTSQGVDILGVYYDGTNYYWSIPNPGTAALPAAITSGTYDVVLSAAGGALKYDSSTVGIEYYADTEELRLGGDIIAFYSSDKRLKSNIVEIKKPIEKIKQIRGVKFDWNDLTEKEGTEVGVIAQEIEKVLPEVVVTRENGYKAVRYDKLIALLIEAIKDQQKQIDSLKNE